MLILSRNRNESIVIGEDIRVTVVDIQVEGFSVDMASARLGVQAPRDVAVHRQEIFDRIHSSRSPGSGKPKPKRNRPGKREAIRGAAVRLRIEVPCGTDVQCSRASRTADRRQQLDMSIGKTSGSAGETDAASARQVFNIECRKDDHLLIGGQLVLMIVDVGRYVIDK